MEIGILGYMWTHRVRDADRMRWSIIHITVRYAR